MPYAIDPPLPPNGITSPPITVLAVSRAQPATQTMHAQPTLTAIVRTPSTTPLVLSPEHGIEGHRSAVHDAQVYAFFAQHYDYWTARLGIARAAWDWAFWGENLTLRVPEGVDETNVRIGDRWVFSSREADGKDGDGEGVVLEVCGGRNPCSRLAWRCGQPGSWLAQVAKTGFCGVYLKIIRGGSIAAGDTARIIPTSSKDTVPAASISQCAYSSLTDPATRTLAQQILRAPGLQNMNRQVIQRKLGMIEETAAAGMNRWAGWRSLRVVDVVDECASVKSFYLGSSDERPLATYVPGQFLTIKLPSGQIRCWSISSWSPSSTTSLPPVYRITVKKGPSASKYLHSQISKGDTLLARSPAGSFVPDWSKEFPPRQIYLSAGIGVTPILSMLQAHFAHPTLAKTPAILIHIARNSAEDLTRVESQLPSSDLFRTIRFYTAPTAGVDVQGETFEHAGRPTHDFYDNLLGEPYKIDPLGITPIELPGNLSNAYICGPPDFVDTTRGFLEKCRVPPPAIHHETFASNSDQPLKIDSMLDTESGDTEIPDESTIQFREKDVKWKKDEELSILQLLERDSQGDEPDSACRVGDCGTCEVKILEGEARVSKKAGKEAREASGKPGTVIRTCCSFPASQLLKLEF